jgi:hypothetical protein
MSAVSVVECEGGRKQKSQDHAYEVQAVMQCQLAVIHRAEAGNRIKGYQTVDNPYGGLLFQCIQHGRYPTGGQQQAQRQEGNHNALVRQHTGKATYREIASRQQPTGEEL